MGVRAEFFEEACLYPIPWAALLAMVNSSLKERCWSYSFWKETNALTFESCFLNFREDRFSYNFCFLTDEPFIYCRNTISAPFNDSTCEVIICCCFSRCASDGWYLSHFHSTESGWLAEKYLSQHPATDIILFLDIWTVPHFFSLMKDQIKKGACRTSIKKKW